MIAAFRELEVDRIVGMTHADKPSCPARDERLNMAYEGPCWDDGTGVLYAAERSTWTPPGRT